MQTICRSLILCLLMTATFVLHANWQDQINDIISNEQAPPGIVFEIISGDEDYLEHAIPAVRRQAKRLRSQFKGLPIAVVTHGSEQFALMAKKQNAHKKLHDTVKVMSLTEDISVHVCGTHAGWRDVEPEDFPDYVDVSPAAPAQINDYIELGYVLVEVDD